MKIHILSESMINQIAAGEVIENPASVVKELVENAIDALSSEIVISIKGGGFLLILVEDNGKGMEPDDFPLAIKRHATSKIAAIEDLQTLKTLGFRGEALSSIASVSKMRIESSRGSTGFEMEVVRGEEIASRKTSRTQGTTIEVKSLFFSTPVRKKFQKSISANIAEIHRLLEQFALAYPEIKFSFFSDDQLVFETSSLLTKQNFFESFKERVFSFYPDSFCQSATQISSAEEFVKIEGFLGEPTLASSTRRHQMIFLNRRIVSSFVLSQAIEDGYGTRLNEKMHPAFVLHLFLPSALVDVNVHPQKKQVRLREEVLIKKHLATLVSKAFQSQNQISISHETVKKFTSQSISFENFEKKPSQDFVESEQLNIFTKESFLKDKFTIISLIEPYAFLEGSLDFLPFKENEKKLVVANLESAYARSLFEMLFSIKEKKQQMETQTLTTPYVMELSKDQILRLNDLSLLLSSLGFELRRIGEKTIAFETIPSFLKNEELSVLMPSLIEELLECGRTEILEKKLKLSLARISCRIAKMKKSFSFEEAQLILKQCMRTKEPLIDPFGEPVFVKLSKKELDNFFKKEKSYEPVFQ